MLLSSYLFPLLCLAHSTQSVAHPTLNKRFTKEVITFASDAGSASHNAASTSSSFHSAENLERTFDQVHPTIPHSGDTHVPLPNQNEVSHPEPIINGNTVDSELPPLPEKPAPKVTASLHFKYRILSGWNSLYFSLRRVTNLFSLGSPPRLFSYVTKLEAQFSKVPLQEQNRQAVVEQVFEELNKKKEYLSYIKGNHAINDRAKLEQETVGILGKIYQVLNTDRHGEDMLGVSRRIRAMLEPTMKPSGGSDGFAALATRLSRFNARELERSRIAIRVYGGKRVAPVAHLHGFLGPENVFAPMLSTILEDKTIVGDLPEAFKANEFVEDLEQLQTHLTGLDKYQLAVRQASKTLPDVTPSPEIALSAIDDFYQKQIKIFEDRQKFQALIDKVKNSRLYQDFQTELNYPNGKAAYELQFVKPVTEARQFNPATTTVSEVQKSGLQLAQIDQGANALHQAQIPARSNTAGRIALAAQTQQIRNQMSEIFTPKGIAYLSSHIQNLTP